MRFGRFLIVIVLLLWLFHDEIILKMQTGQYKKLDYYHLNMQKGNSSRLGNCEFSHQVGYFYGIGNRTIHVFLMIGNKEEKDLLYWFFGNLIKVKNNIGEYSDGHTRIIFSDHFYGQKNILIIGKWPIEPIPDGLLGAILLGDENCNNLFLENLRLLFAFTTYGTCAKNKQTHLKGKWRPWPLGPSIGPYKYLYKEKKTVLLASQRPFFVNGQMTITPQKISRMNALITMQDFCYRKKKNCRESTHWDIFFGHYFPAHNRFLYEKAILKSRFTLCPSGNNAETYRIWEALECGSIPIIEDLDELEQNLKYGKNFFCNQNSQHELLRSSPVFFIKNWSTDLEPILSLSNEEVDQRQILLRLWYTDFKNQLLLEVVESIKQFFY